MLIEILGLPGAGKSTLVREILPRLREHKLKSRHGHKLAGLKSRDPEAPRFLRGLPDRLTLYRAETFRHNNPKLIKHLERKVGLSLPDQFLFSLTTSFYQASLEYADEMPFVFLDEGFIHRGAEAHYNGKDTADFATFLKLIPVPDAILHVKIDPESAFARAVERRSDKRDSEERVIAKLGDLREFETRAALLKRGIAALVARGAALIEIDALEPVEACGEIAMEQLLSLHAAQHDVPQIAAE